MKDHIYIRSEKLFPFHFQLLGIVLVLTGILSVIITPFLAPVLILISLLIFTGSRGIEIDLEKNQYREFNSFLFMKFGTWEAYDDVEKIYINAVHASQMIYTRVTEGTTVKNVVYKAFIKFGDGSKVYLLSSKDKDKVYEQLTELSGLLQLEILDNTV